MNLVPDHLPLVLATFLLAGFVKGVVGLGLPTVAMGLLGLAMSADKAAAFLLLPSLVTNIWQLLAGPGAWPAVRRLAPMLAGIVAGTLLTSGLVAGGGGAFSTTALGLALLAYAALGLLRWQPALRPGIQRWAGPLVGLLTGMMTGATGVFVIPAVPYLASLGLKRDELVQALGLSFTVSTLALAAGLAAHGALAATGLGASLLALAPALAGMMLGGLVRRRVPPGPFRVCFFIGLAALGLELTLRGLRG